MKTFYLVGLFGLMFSFSLKGQWKNPMENALPKAYTVEAGVKTVKAIPAQEEEENYRLYEYNEQGDMTYEAHYRKGELKKEKQYVYDGKGQKTSQVNIFYRRERVDKDTVFYRYNAQGLLLEELTHAEGATSHQITYRYDSEGRLVEETTYHFDGYQEDIPASKKVYEYSKDGRTLTYFDYAHNPASIEEDPFYVRRKEVRHYASREHEKILKWSIYSGSMQDENLEFKRQFLFTYNDQELVGEVKVIDETGALHKDFPGPVHIKLEYDAKGAVIQSDSFDPETGEVERSSRLKYDADGRVNNIEDRVNGQEREMRVSYDAQGNWTHIVIFVNGERKSTGKRILEYF